MPLKRYTITLVKPGTADRPTLLVPFEPSAIVISLIEELFRRIKKQGLAFDTGTHICTLTIDSEDGAMIDCEDVLSDVVTDPENEKIFASFREKDRSTAATQAVSQAADQAVAQAASTHQDNAPTIAIRVNTSQTAAHGNASCIQVPLSATFRQLHSEVAKHLALPDKVASDLDTNECNCNLARKIAEDPPPPKQCIVVHGKSLVQRFNLATDTADGVRAVLRDHFGDGVEGDLSRKNMSFFNAAVVAICSKHRHRYSQVGTTEARSQVGTTEARSQVRTTEERVVDLHTTETPVHPACMDLTLQDAGLHTLHTVDGVLDIYAVHRLTEENVTNASTGKDSIFRVKSCWQPCTPQSERGQAMMLSSLRVFAQLVQITNVEESKDAILHIFDLLTGGFLPALRALHILTQGKTPTLTERAALSASIFEILNTSVPAEVIGGNKSRVFESARLLFGFILEKARGLKLSSTDNEKLPYLSAMSNVDLKDHKTSEPVMKAVMTTDGLVESGLYDALADTGLLARHGSLQSNMVKTDVDPVLARVSLITGGTAAETLVFSQRKLQSNYQYADGGNIDSMLDLLELSCLNNLAEHCGGVGLAVYKPSQLSSAVQPSLTFDRRGHLAVYLGEQACANPGESSMVFRPLHGAESINCAVIEQLIAPILATYDADGSAVFDAFGGAAVRKLSRPDECVMFVVDISASMRLKSDFDEFDEYPPEPTTGPTVESLVHSSTYNLVRLEDVKEQLLKHESFDDMVAMVAEASRRQRAAATDVVVLLCTMIGHEILQTSKQIEKCRERSRFSRRVQQELSHLETVADRLKLTFAGLKTHGDATCDFLMFRASNLTSASLSRKWQWTLSEESMPTARSAASHIPTLPADVTEVPDELRCPVSHSLMEDAVTAADVVTYSREAISRWFKIRESSPMHGYSLNDTSLAEAQRRRVEVSAFIAGGRLVSDPAVASPRNRKASMLITFLSPVGSFDRRMQNSANIRDLYKVAFRGLKARYNILQLAVDHIALMPSEATLASKSLCDGARIEIRIADEADLSDMPSTSPGLPHEMCLIKVHNREGVMLFGYWVRKDKAGTMSSVLWKYWRHRLFSHPFSPSDVLKKCVWSDMKHSGDGMVTGQPRDNSERLSNLLNALNCTGTLSAESLYDERAGHPGPPRAMNGPLVLKVAILPPCKPKDQGLIQYSRLDVLKQMFEALINRMIAPSYSSHLGLITVSSTAQIAMPMSHVLENFRRAVNDMSATGDTALFDALALAKASLVDYTAEKYPNASKRIIVISDGNDTKSVSSNASSVCLQLRDDGIVVDSVSLGNEEDLDLRTISSMLGGYRFHPASLAEAMMTTELEPFLSLSERPHVTPTPVAFGPNMFSFRSAFAMSRMAAHQTSAVTVENVPPRREHPNINDEFIELAAIAALPGSSAPTGGSRRSTLRTSRLMSEIKRLADSQHPTYDVYVSETDLSFWKVVMSGAGAYDGGTFLLYLHADEGYPNFAPKARFITKILHPNVNAHGRICHSIFDRDWTSDVSSDTLLNMVYGLLLEPEASDPVNTMTTLEWHDDRTAHTEAVRECTRSHASKTREEWRAELLG